MRAMIVVLVVFSSASPQAAELVRRDPLEIRAVMPSAPSVPVYSRLELTLDLKATYDNPFDPADIDVYAEFVSPKGDTRRVNGFLSQACERKLENNAESIKPTGEPFWQIRFCPDCEGTWRYKVLARDRTGRVESPESTFDATAATTPGYVRRNAISPHIFQFDNGRPYVAIGENMCWGGARGTYDYDDWLPALAKGGGNWIRIWMFRWHCGIEWSTEDRKSWDTGAFGGLGVYNLANAWKLDTILDTAERNGVYVMLCLGTYGEFITGGYFNEGLWATNPYNAADGGPCAKPEEFWTNEKARALYKQRLRYIAARYGWRPNLFAWEFWNEAYAPAPWVAEMAQFLKGKGAQEGTPADPFGHLVSTTYGKPDVWELPEVDFTMSHHYGEANLPDEAPITHNDAAGHRKYGKPHLVAEFGIDWRSSDDKQDPQFRGVNLHNAIWASVFSGNAGSAMIWYWDGYVHPGNLYSQFAPLRTFVDRVPWDKGPWTPLEIDPPQTHPQEEAWRDLAIAPTATWGKSTVESFTVTPTSGVGGQSLPTFLFGEWKKDLRSPLVLNVNFERSGHFDVRVNAVSTRVVMRMALDGQVVREVPLSAEPPKDGSAPEYESTEFKDEYQTYQAKFNKKYGIDIPSGAHRITIEVTDGDWLSVADYTFTGYVSNRFPKINIYGITNGSKAFLWAQNAEHNWLNVRDNAGIPAIPESTTSIHGLPDGTYACEWWDTWKGEPVAKSSTTSTDGTLSLTLPPLSKDCAAAILPAP